MVVAVVVVAVVVVAVVVVAVVVVAGCCWLLKFFLMFCFCCHCC